MSARCSRGIALVWGMGAGIDPVAGAACSSLKAATTAGAASQKAIATVRTLTAEKPARRICDFMAGPRLSGLVIRNSGIRIPQIGTRDSEFRIRNSELRIRDSEFEIRDLAKFRFPEPPGPVPRGRHHRSDAGPEYRVACPESRAPCPKSRMPNFIPPALFSWRHPEG